MILVLVARCPTKNEIGRKKKEIQLAKNFVTFAINCYSSNRLGQEEAQPRKLEWLKFRQQFFLIRRERLNNFGQSLSVGVLFTRNNF